MSLGLWFIFCPSLLHHLISHLYETVPFFQDVSFYYHWAWSVMVTKFTAKQLSLHLILSLLCFLLHFQYINQFNPLYRLHCIEIIRFVHHCRKSSRLNFFWLISCSKFWFLFSLVGWRGRINERCCCETLREKYNRLKGYYDRLTNVLLPYVPYFICAFIGGGTYGIPGSKSCDP